MNMKMTGGRLLQIEPRKTQADMNGDVYLLLPRSFMVFSLTKQPTTVYNLPSIDSTCMPSVPEWPLVMCFQFCQSGPRLFLKPCLQNYPCMSGQGLRGMQLCLSTVNMSSQVEKYFQVSLLVVIMRGTSGSFSQLAK